MVDDFDRVLDTCLDRVKAGEDLNAVLADYPSYSAELRPLLLTATQTSGVYNYAVNSEAKRASKQRFDAALVAARERRRVKQPWFSRNLLRPATLAAIATTIVALIVVIIGVQAVLSPGSPQIAPITPVARPDGNFVFLISDEVNAIDKFTNVSVNITKIGIQQNSDSKWIEITPTTTLVDLTTVPGDATNKIWQGDVPPGNYRQVFVYVDNVTGILKASGQLTEIKLPSQKLHMSIPFSVSDNTVTSFTYDMTVVATGNVQNVKYILKPQIGESGAQQLPRDNGDKPKNDDNNSNTNNQYPTNVPPSQTKPPKK